MQNHTQRLFQNAFLNLKKKKVYKKAPQVALEKSEACRGLSIANILKIVFPITQTLLLI